MKTISKFLIIIAIIMMNGCEKNDDSKTELSGTWIELNYQMDTLVFENWDSGDVFELKRGSELVNGNILPKYGSGLYQYQLKPDSILINNMLWSCMCYPSYYFRMNSTFDTFEIGNFYDTTSAVNQRITFFKFQ